MITVDQVAALARDASMSSSYKPALLKALVRIVRGGATSPISLLHIGHEFVDLYWVQTVVFRLRQAATITAEPEVVRRIRSTSDLSSVRSLTELPADTRQRLDGEMARVLTINVLDRFHKSAPNGMPRLYDWHPGDDFISIDHETLAFIRGSGHALETIANHRWARYLERVNMLAPLIIEKVERNGAQRGSLAKYLKILRVTDRTHCFYCERVVGDGETPHVDHVIPWSFLLSYPPVGSRAFMRILQPRKIRRPTRSPLPRKARGGRRGSRETYVTGRSRIAAYKPRRARSLLFGGALGGMAFGVGYPARDRRAGAFANCGLVSHPAD